MAERITPIEVTNKALVLIGALPITSFQDTSAEAVVANQIYEDIVLDSLSKHDWSFATGKISLNNNRLADKPKAQFAAAYQAPTSPRPVSYMRLWVNGSISAFDVSEDRVLCNAGIDDDVVLEYQFRPVEDRWLPAFRLYVIYRLASEFASTITRKAEEIELWQNKAAQQFETARLRDDKGRISPWVSDDLVNQALSLIGALPVTQVSQNAVEAIIANGVYDEIRKQGLAAHDWPFAMKQAELTRDDTFTSYRQRDAAYTAPEDMLTPFRAWINGHHADFTAERDHILVDLSAYAGEPDTATVALEYKADVPEGEWYPGFRWYIAYRLASEMVGAIGGSAQAAGQMDQKAERQLAKARTEANDGRSPPRLKMRTSRLTSARLRGLGPNAEPK